MPLVKPNKTPPRETIKSHPLLVTRGFFTVEEDAWIWDHMQEFSTISGRGKVDSPGGTSRITPAAAHHARLKEAFASVFPYRNPYPKPGTMVKKEYAQLMCSVKDWEAIGSRIYNFLRRRLNDFERNERADAPWGSDYSAYLEEVRDLGPDYRAEREIAEETESAMTEIARESRYSWAEVQDAELIRRQTNLPTDMQTVMNMMSRSTGAEIYAVAVWQHEGEVLCCDSTTRRIPGFNDTPSAHNFRLDFQNYIFQRIGASMETSLSHAGRAVVGDPDADYRPVLPEAERPTVDLELLRETSWIASKLTYAWTWQGGQGSPPWDLFEKDARSGAYAMIEARRLPPNIKELRSPTLWNLDERKAWSTHLRRGEAGELPEEEVFQYMQTTPGIFDFGYRRERPGDVQLNYHPESIAFALRQDRIRRGEPTGVRADDLPFFRPGEMYVPISEEEEKRLGDMLSGNAVLEPLRLLNELEEWVPHQASEEFWHSNCAPFPHVLNHPPADDAMFEHFEKHDWCIREEFFNHLDPEHAKWSLPACIAWCHPSRWFHEPSHTLEGGPYGIKWPILFLVFLVGCATSITRGNMPVFPRNTLPQFLDRDMRQLDDIAKLWVVEIGRSAQTLNVSYSERSLHLSGVAELSHGQNANSVVLLGPDREPSEWEAKGIDPNAYDLEGERNKDPTTPRPSRKRRTSGSGSRRKRARTAGNDGLDVDELAEDIPSPTQAKAKASKKAAKSKRTSNVKVELPAPKAKKGAGVKAVPRKKTITRKKKATVVLSDVEPEIELDRNEEAESSETWVDVPGQTDAKRTTRSMARRLD